MSELIEGRVLRSQSGQLWVSTDRGVVHCTMRGRLKREKKARTDLAVIGDRARVRITEGLEGVVEEVTPRENRFARRQPGKRGVYKEDVLVANLDRLFAVFSCASPPMNPRLLDRFLVVAELDGIPAGIVANKVDQVERAEAERQFGPYAELGYPVFYTSALGGEGIDALRAELRSRVSAFVGPSGVESPIGPILRTIESSRACSFASRRSACGPSRKRSAPSRMRRTSPAALPLRTSWRSMSSRASP